MTGILRMRGAGLFGTALAVILAGFAGGGKNASVFETEVPTDAVQLKELQEKIQEIAAKAVPCTVGIKVGAAVEGSGVVVSENGYVLTAAHVSGQPGREVSVRFADGKTVKGMTLGVHTDADGGLIKITDEGTYPFVPVISHDEYPKPGDWCVATGHPGGFQDKRTPPVRLGRIIDVDQFTLRTDCTITGGDSGGPLFDMQGRVIGIHSRISEQATVNLHGPVLAYVEAWDHLKAGEIYPPVPSSRFLIHFDIDRDGKVTRDEQPEGPYRRMYDRLAEQYNLDVTKAYTLAELKTEELGWQDLPRRITIRPYQPETDPEHTLNQDQYVRGKGVRAAFQPIVARAAASTVDVFCDGEQVAYGTAVRSDGLIVTKASRLVGKIECRLPGGSRLPAEIVTSDAPNDLAIVRVEAELAPVSWTAADGLALGSWLATPNVEGEAVSVGIVSVGERAIAGTPGVLGVQIRPNEQVVGATIEHVVPESGAAEAGLQPDDIITSVMGEVVRSLEELQKAVRAHHAGKVIKIAATRGDKELEFNVTLGMPEDVFEELLPFQFRGRNRLSGPLNRRRDDFPNAIQHDSVLLPNQCGGPVVNVDGEAVGINVARADRTHSYAVPARTVIALVEKVTTDSAEE